MSPGFDPDKDLEAIGLANQTTMLRNETTAIGKLLEKTMMAKYGPAELKKHYMVMDTICDATQVRLFILLPPSSHTRSSCWRGDHGCKGGMHRERGGEWGGGGLGA